MNASDFNFFNPPKKSTAPDSVAKATHESHPAHSVRVPALQICRPNADDGDSFPFQRNLEMQIARVPDSSAEKGSDSVLRAAYMRLELSRFFTLQQAMSDPAYAIAIRNMAAAIARGASAEEIAKACDHDQPNFRLEFTQVFRAELQAAISAREQEAIDVS